MISFVLLILQFMDIIVAFYDRAEDAKYSANVYISPSQSSDANKFTPWISREHQLKGNVLFAAKVSSKTKMPIVDTQHSDRSGERVVNVSEDSLAIACGILYCMSLLMPVLAIVEMFSMLGDFVADIGTGSGTFTLGAVLRRRNAIALDMDKSQQPGFWNRLAITQSSVLKEHDQLTNSKSVDTLKHYRSNIHHWNFMSNVDVHSLKAAVREELRQELLELQREGEATFLPEGSADGAKPAQRVESFVRVGEQDVAIAEMMTQQQQYNQAIQNSMVTHQKELSKQNAVLRPMFCLNTCGIV